MDRSSHVNVDPDALKVEAEMGANEQASTRALGIAAILGEGGRGEGEE